MRHWLIVAALLLALVVTPVAAAEEVIIGSKRFTESYVLGEVIRKTLEQQGIATVHRQGMGNTSILWQALQGGAIHVYPEYTGTINEEILKSPEPLDVAAIRRRLNKMGIGMTGELGFNNTYALVMRADQAEDLNITRISDLRSHPDLRVGLTHEFLKRQDGWEPLARRYGLSMTQVRGIDHALGYAALNSGQIDVKDAYSTDAKIGEYNLKVLEDDLSFFPRYNAVLLYRLETPPEVVEVLETMEGTIDEPLMIRMNALAEQTKSYSQAADVYLAGGAGSASASAAPSLAQKLTRWTLQHLWLVGISMLLAIVVGIPLGIIASRPGPLSQIILGSAGVLQTIPSLALLALLVPIAFFGISARTAIFALFLYSLLPIVRNTAVGLQDIPLPIRESAAALGLEPRAQLTKVFLPIALPTILAGIKTSAVINVGTATLAALIGAGGLGEPIISGLSLNDNATILQGAIPAAILALLVQFAFDGLDRLVTPRGLRLSQNR